METAEELPQNGIAENGANPSRSVDSDGLDYPKWMFWKRRRYVVTAMTFLGFFNVFTLRVNVSVAVTAMNSKHSVELSNGTVVEESEFDWSSELQGYVLGSYFYGYITTQIFGGWLAARIGGNILFGFGIAVTAFLTLLTPTLARISVYWFIAIRVIEGIFEGVSYPSMHDVWANWAPPLERSRLATIGYSGSYFGTVVAMTISGILSSNVGWPSVFYVFGGIGVVWYIAWLFLVRRRPEDDKYIDILELKYIQRTLGPTAENQKVRKIFCSGAFMCQCVFMLSAAFVLTPAGAITCLTLAVGLGAFAMAGFFVNHLDLAPVHASVLMGIGNTAGTLPGIISPTITGYLTPNKTTSEWRIVFFIASGIYFVGAMFYALFASGEKQSWADDGTTVQDTPSKNINEMVEREE